MVPVCQILQDCVDHLFYFIGEYIHQAFFWYLKSLTFSSTTELFQKESMHAFIVNRMLRMIFFCHLRSLLHNTLQI